MGRGGGRRGGKSGGGVEDQYGDSMVSQDRGFPGGGGRGGGSAGAGGGGDAGPTALMALMAPPLNRMHCPRLVISAP